MARGELTTEIKGLSKKLFGYEFNVTELRLLPYIQHCLMNEQNIDIRKINAADRLILMKWQKEKRLSSPASNLIVSPKFYDNMCKLLKVAYCFDSVVKSIE